MKHSEQVPGNLQVLSANIILSHPQVRPFTCQHHPAAGHSRTHRETGLLHEVVRAREGQGTPELQDQDPRKGPTSSSDAFERRIERGKEPSRFVGDADVRFHTIRVDSLIRVLGSQLSNNCSYNGLTIRGRRLPYSLNEP